MMQRDIGLKDAKLTGDKTLSNDVDAEYGKTQSTAGFGDDGFGTKVEGKFAEEIPSCLSQKIDSTAVIFHRTCAAVNVHSANVAEKHSEEHSQQREKNTRKAPLVLVSHRLFCQSVAENHPDEPILLGNTGHGRARRRSNAGQVESLSPHASSRNTRQRSPPPSFLFNSTK